MNNVFSFHRFVHSDPLMSMFPMANNSLADDTDCEAAPSDCVILRNIPRLARRQTSSRRFSDRAELAARFRFSDRTRGSATVRAT